jgi:hypothetical protein
MLTVVLNHCERCAVLVLTSILVATPAAAQSKPIDLTSKPIDLTLGYESRASCFDCGSTGGFSAEIGRSIAPRWNWIGAFDTLHQQLDDKHVSSLTFFGGGARWTPRGSANGLKPFAQVLVGATRRTVDVDDFGSLSEVKFAVGLDGGVVVPLNQYTSLVGELGLRRIRTPVGTNITPRTVIGIRCSVGTK